MNIRDRIVGLRRVPARELRPNPRNWRTHPQSQQDALRGILAEVGYVDALLAVERDGGLMLLDGHLRAETTPDVEVPVLVVDLTDEEAAKVLATFDPLSAMAEADGAKLDALLREVDTGSAALQEMLAELAKDAGLYQTPAEIVEDEVPPVPVDPVTKPGNLWALGEHRLLCGDSTKVEDVAKLLGGRVPFIMVTDPPYWVEYDADRRNAVDKGFAARAIGKVENDDNASWGKAWELFGGVAAYVWHACTFCHIVAADLEATGLEIRNQIIWRKARFVMAPYGINANQVEKYGLYHWQHETCWYSVRRGRSSKWCGDRSQSTIWDIAHTKNETGHSTQKPVECMARPIRNHGGLDDDVYDPFLGSGTTIIAAEQLGRRCFSVEIAPAYCDVAVTRWENLTGRKAELVNG